MFNYMPKYSKQSKPSYFTVKYAFAEAYIILKLY